MSKLLLLVQSEADVQHLDGAAQAILNSAITGVWVVFSPAITVNASEAAGKLDTEIEALRTAEDQAAGRRDYAAAAGYKTQREGKELDRQKALRDAWKTAPAEERKKKAQEAFAPLIAQLQPNGVNVKITAHGDHYDRDQWVAMLNSLTGAWFKEFTVGGFMVGWPEAVEMSIRSAAADAQIRLGPTSLDRMRNTSLTVAEAKAADAVVKQKIVMIPDETPEKPEAVKQAEVRVAKALPEIMKPGVPKTRREELASMKYFTLVGAAKKAGVDPAGKKGPQIIDEILAAEEKKIEPALAEY